MVVYLQMAKLMYNDVVNAVNRNLDEFQIQENAACLGTTSPSFWHLADGNTRLMNTLEGWALFQANLQSMSEDVLSVIPIPAFHQRLDSLAIFSISGRDMQESANKLDCFRRSFMHL